MWLLLHSISRFLTEDPHQRLGSGGASEVILVQAFDSFLFKYLEYISWANTSKILSSGETACILQRYQLGHTCQAEGSVCLYIIKYGCLFVLFQVLDWPNHLVLLTKSSCHFPRLHLFQLQRVHLIPVTSQVATHGILQMKTYIQPVTLRTPAMLIA